MPGLREAHPEQAADGPTASAGPACDLSKKT